jgi:hypothetical protein
MNRDTSGEWAWLGLAAVVTSYDLYAIKTRKVETLSTALWKSLANPVKAPVSFLIWGSLTWHLFLNKQARNSYKQYF